MGWAKKGWMQHERSKWWPWCCIHRNSINTALFLTKTVYILKFNAKHKSSNQFTLYYLFEIWQQKSIHILKLISAQNGALLFWILHHIYYVLSVLRSSTRIWGEVNDRREPEKTTAYGRKTRISGTDGRQEFLRPYVENTSIIAPRGKIFAGRGQVAPDEFWAGK